jgi:ABC-type lipoprotein export system ATPase subunit
VALLGASGAGKTTVMRKLLRFDDPTSGCVLIDGIDLRTIRQASWRRGIGYIPQQAQVFDGSIRYNLTYRLKTEERAKITDAELWKLMQLLQIDFKDRLTHGLDTIVGKNGIKLSGGQAQRLMIGAAVIKRPWLLVVDEATSSLDSATEHEVQARLATVLSGFGHQRADRGASAEHGAASVHQVCRVESRQRGSGWRITGRSHRRFVRGPVPRIPDVPSFGGLSGSKHRLGRSRRARRSSPSVIGTRCRAARCSVRRPQRIHLRLRTSSSSSQRRQTTEISRHWAGSRQQAGLRLRSG